MNKKILLGFLAILICLTFLACSQKEPPVFSYDLKDSYSSRTEISKEKESMLYAFADFINDNSRGSQEEKDEFYDNNNKIYQNLKSQLDEMYNNMTFSVEEIESSKDARIDYLIKNWELQLVECSYKLDQYGPAVGTNPTANQYNYELAKKIYEATLEIKEDYLNGKISRKEAINKIKNIKEVYIN